MSSAQAIATIDSTSGREVISRLRWAASFAAALMVEIDNEDEISKELETCFSAALLRTADGIDQARQLNDAFDGMRAQLTLQKARIAVALDTIHQRQTSLEDHLKRVITDNPGVPFRDSMSKKVYVRASPPSVKFSFETRKKTVNHIAPEGDVVPDEFLETVTHRVINTEAVRAALKADRVLHFAWLEQGHALCGL